MALSSRALARALRSGALATSSRSMRPRGGGGGGGLVPPMVQRDPIQEKVRPAAPLRRRTPAPPAPPTPHRVLVTLRPPASPHRPRAPSSTSTTTSSGTMAAPQKPRSTTTPRTWTPPPPRSTGSAASASSLSSPFLPTCPSRSSAAARCARRRCGPGARRPPPHRALPPPRPGPEGLPVSRPRHGARAPGRRLGGRVACVHNPCALRSALAHRTEAAAYGGPPSLLDYHPHVGADLSRLPESGLSAPPLPKATTASSGPEAGAEPWTSSARRQPPGGVARRREARKAGERNAAHTPPLRRASAAATLSPRTS